MSKGGRRAGSPLLLAVAPRLAAAGRRPALAASATATALLVAAAVRLLRGCGLRSGGGLYLRSDVIPDSLVKRG